MDGTSHPHRDSIPDRPSHSIKSYIAVLNVHKNQLMDTRNSWNEETFKAVTIKYATYLLNEPFHSAA